MDPPADSKVVPEHPAQNVENGINHAEEPPTKRVKLDEFNPYSGQQNGELPQRQKGIAPIKAEYAMPRALRILR
jgi:hypothetical protein